MKDRLLKTVTGYETAKAFVARHIVDFNESNERGGDDVMRATSASGLRAEDYAGSGEFIEARCVNSMDAENCAAEIYEIYVLW